MNKTARQSVDHAEEPLELENHFILRLPENSARDVRDWLQNGESQFKDKLQINFNPDMRHAQVKVEKEVFNATLMDLPCVIETLKTVDKKNFYKVADISQILICKHGDEDPTKELNVSSKPEQTGTGDDNANKKKDKQFQYPHGITPPLKNVRKRRFRKTLKKKYMDAPELEKELKRLLRADLDAEKSRYEIITVEQEMQQKLMQKAGGTKVPLDSIQSSDNTIVVTNPREDELFGTPLSSSSEDEDDAEGRELAQQLMMENISGTTNDEPSEDPLTITNNNNDDSTSFDQ